MPVRAEPHAAQRVAGDHAAGDQLGDGARQQFFDHPQPGGEQAVRVPALRNAPAGLGADGAVEFVPVDDGDPVVPVGESPGGEQSGHARAEHNRVPVLPRPARGFDHVH
jgi:hypothetical protein